MKFFPKLTFLHSSIIFNLVWISSVGFKSPLVGLCFLIIWLFLLQPKKRELSYVLIVGSIGLAIDMCFVRSGWITLSNEHPAHLILPLLWVAFPCLTLCFFKHFRLSMSIVSIVTVVSGFFSYYAATSFSVITINWHNYLFTIFFILFWLGLMPIAKVIFRRLECV